MSSVQRWWRRPRRPIPSTLQSWRLGVGLGVVLALGIVAGPVIALDDASPARTRLAFAAWGIGSVLVAALAALHLRRPATVLPDHSVDDSAVSRWAQELRRRGRVEIGRSRRGILKVCVRVLPGSAILAGVAAVGLADASTYGVVVALAMLTVLAVMAVCLWPHVDFATGRGPGLLVEPTGVTVGRRHPVVLSWDELVGVEVLGGERRSATSSVVLEIDAPHLTTAGRSGHLTRLTDTITARFDRPAVVIPSTIDAAAQDVGAWLTRERAARRRR